MNVAPASLDPRIRRTRQMLFEALLALLGEKSFEEISVQDIAERSTVNRATIYDHFTDKFALLEALIDEKFRAKFEEHLAGTDCKLHEGLRQTIVTVGGFLKKVADGGKEKHRPLGPMVESIIERRIKLTVSEFFRDGLQGQARNAEEAALRATAISWAICGTALEWSRTQTTSLDALADAVIPLLAPILEPRCSPASLLRRYLPRCKKK